MSIGIIGCGSLGTAIFRSLRSLHTNADFVVSVKSTSRLTQLKHQLKCNVTQSNFDVISSSKDIFLCVKPANAREVCQEIKGKLDQESIVVSVMAAVPLLNIQEWLQHARVVKTMPTMSVAKGPVTIYNPLNLNFKKFSENFITVDDETTLDMTTAVSGCMPGFLANVLEQWINAAVNMGIEKELAEQLICSNAAAFSNLNAFNLVDLRSIQSQVASKGGATEKGLGHLNQSDLYKILGTTMSIANNRVLEFARKLREENF